ncbi:MAG: biopolymer transporter ExbD [Bacteroides sp.]|nr:biopolymer transporter ExbD [Bacteroides sp.]MBD5297212.1 biopolymer transporter ExbD [Bacteroides sp.]MBD5320324.1 biopolymer transporter ExbD [Bacteroides sp.]MBD5351153.1 biopolymer transporter ExbD [Bacteroides sp.]MDE6039063.1 biopolymer transporter ExbD [Paramuribaculum sp.]
MGKVKIKRKSTLIDMTAMSDVTVLLLTFFMLTSTFLQKEPTQVETPSSVQEQKVSTSNVVNVLVSPTGEVFLSVAGEVDPDASANYAKEQDPTLTAAELRKEKGKWASDSVRREVILQAVADYNETAKNPVQLTTDEVAALAKIGTFGVPFADLKKYLELNDTQRDKVYTDFFKLSPEEREAYNKNRENVRVGIPIDLDHNKRNEFQIWMRAIKKVAQSKYPNLNEALTKGEGIAVKADRRTDFEKMHVVLDNLQTLRMTRFTLMTALKSQEQ